MKPAKKAVGKAVRRAAAPRLSRDDWLDAAFHAVVEGGFDNVRVLVIADTLGVTRGSFYWHFTDHADLVAALLARWQEREMALDAQWRGESAADARTELENLLDAALAHTGVDVENVRFELALRGLGRRDPTVATMLAAVDAARMSLFEFKFMRLTGQPKQAAELAALFYLAIAGGHQALSRPASPPQLKEYIRNIIADYLIRQQVPAAPARARAATKRG
jgi:AcrR family transcriptional regulator